MTKESGRTAAITQLLHSPALRASLTEHQHVLYYHPSATLNYIDCEFGLDRLHDIIEVLAESANYRFMHCTDYQQNYFDLYFTELTGIISSESTYHAIDSAQVKDLINNHSEWYKLRNALARLLQKHNIYPEAKLEHCLNSIEDYREALAGRGGFRLIKFSDSRENYNIHHPANLAFDNEPQALRHILEYLCAGRGMIIGEANITEFINKGGDALFQATVSPERRPAYLKEIRELVKSEPWLFPTAAQLVNNPAREH